jgi:type II secretory pathway pseudopilin PulG
MANQQLLDYIKQRSQQGKERGEIKQELLGAGWQEADVEEALNVMFPQTPVQPPKPSFQPPPAPPLQPQGGTWKNVLTIVFLILLLPVGLILMWTIANWSKKAKIIITVVLLAALIPILIIGGIFVSTVLVSMGGAREAARDAARKADMRQIVTAQEMYWSMNDQYYQSVNYPVSIPNFMMEMPTDPKTEGPYGWVDNTGNNQKFCAFADLEKDGYYVATHGGNGEVTSEPRTISDCEKFSGFWSY